MKWNNRIEHSKFKKEQMLEAEKYRLLGMTKDQIADIQQYEQQQFLRKRRERESGYEETSYRQFQADGTEYVLEHPALQYEDDFYPEDPFQYGFSDKRMENIIADADETDMEILRLLFRGVPQDKISALLGINQSNISRRIQKMKKFFSENA